MDPREMPLPPFLLFIHLACSPVCVSRGAVGDQRGREEGEKGGREGGGRACFLKLAIAKAT